jgi:hypothetical protein
VAQCSAVERWLSAVQWGRWLSAVQLGRWLSAVQWGGGSVQCGGWQGLSAAMDGDSSSEEEGGDPQQVSHLSITLHYGLHMWPE